MKECTLIKTECDSDSPECKTCTLYIEVNKQYIRLDNNLSKEK